MDGGRWCVTHTPSIWKSENVEEISKPGGQKYFWKLWTNSVDRI